MLQKHLDAHKLYLGSKGPYDTEGSTSTSPTSPAANVTSPMPIGQPEDTEVNVATSSGGWRTVRKKAVVRPFSEGSADEHGGWQSREDMPSLDSSARAIDRTGLLTFRGLNVEELSKRFKRRRFNKAKEDEVIDKIVNIAKEARSGSSVEMEEILRDFGT